MFVLPKLVFLKIQKKKAINVRSFNSVLSECFQEKHNNYLWFSILQLLAQIYLWNKI